MLDPVSLDLRPVKARLAILRLRIACRSLTRQLLGCAVCYPIRHWDMDYQELSQIPWKVYGCLPCISISWCVLRCLVPHVVWPYQHAEAPLSSIQRPYNNTDSCEGLGQQESCNSNISDKNSKYPGSNIFLNTCECCCPSLPSYAQLSISAVVAAC